MKLGSCILVNFISPGKLGMTKGSKSDETFLEKKNKSHGKQALEYQIQQQYQLPIMSATRQLGWKSCSSCSSGCWSILMALKMLMYIMFCYGIQAQLLYLYSTLVLVLHFTCTAHLCLLYKALMYILSLRNTIQILQYF